MLRSMVFMDYMNFDIAVQDCYANLGLPSPWLDYNVIFKEIALLRNTAFMKAIVCAPMPDQFLLQDERALKKYKWLTGMASAKYIDVVFGRYLSRPTIEGVEKNINDRNTYYKVEKGTDINLAIHAMSMAFHNSFDAAFIMSGDTDYLNLYRALKSMGKIVIVVVVKGQQLQKIIPEVDDFIILSDAFFDKCKREAKPESTPTVK